MMIKPLTTIAEIQPFFPLLGNAEFDSYDNNNAEHLAWLTSRVDQRLYCGGQYFGAFSPDLQPLGAIAVQVEARPGGLLENYLNAEIHQFAVDARQQRQGIGSSLLQYMETQLRQQKVYCMYLHTYPADYSVIACYGKNGFMPVGLVPDVYGPDLEGMLFLRKVLK